MNSFGQQLQDFVQSENAVFQIGVLVAVLVVTVAILWWLTSGKSSRNVVALVGLSGAGKTRAFVKIVGGRESQTVMSQTQNQESVLVNNRTRVNLVDIPGSEKVRGSILSPYKGQLGKLVFFLDSANFSKTSKDVAEYLYDLLSDAALPPKLRVLVVCNKQDQPLAKSSNAVRSALEREFAMLTRTRAAALDSTSGGDTGGKAVLGKPGSEFSFAEASQKVEFMETSVAKDVNEIVNWIGN